MNPYTYKFTLGKTVITRNALRKLDRDSVDNTVLTRYTQGDWGDLSAEDKNMNDEAVKHGGRIFAVYRDANGRKFWVITESDRSVTTILLPEDY